MLIFMYATLFCLNLPDFIRGRADAGSVVGKRDQALLLFYFLMGLKALLAYCQRPATATRVAVAGLRK
jgi:hypothetical protein